MNRPFEVYFLKSCKSGGMGGMVWQKQAKRPNTMPPLFLGGMGWYGVNHLYIFCKTYFLLTMPPCHPCHLFLKKFVKTASEIKNLLKNRWRVARNCVRIVTQNPLHFLILSLWDMPGIGPKKKAQTAMGLSLFFHFLTGQRITYMSTIVKIKQSFPIQQVAARACGGLIPSRSTKGPGIYYLGWCPFCQGGRKPGPDKRRKFWVDTQKQLCGCFKCGDKAMDVINLYGRLNNLDNDTAISDLWAERMMGQRYERNTRNNHNKRAA